MHEADPEAPGEILEADPEAPGEILEADPEKGIVLYYSS